MYVMMPVLTVTHVHTHTHITSGSRTGTAGRNWRVATLLQVAQCGVRFDKRCFVGIGGASVSVKFRQTSGYVFGSTTLPGCWLVLENGDCNLITKSDDIPVNDQQTSWNEILENQLQKFLCWPIDVFVVNIKSIVVNIKGYYKQIFYD